MDFNHTHYVPCLRWKQGEYQAVWRLPNTTKRMLTPLIEIPGPGWDFEEKKEKKTVDELLSDFAQKKIYKKWGSSSCFVDLGLIPPDKRMDNDVHPVRFIFDELRAIKCQAIPVTGLTKDTEYQQEIKAVSDEDKRGVCLRITIEQVVKSSLKTRIDSLLSTLEIKPAGCDFILDLGAPNFVPLDGLVKIMKNIAAELPYLNSWRTFTFLGTSFPESMGGVRKGGEIVPRYEWQLYKKLIASFRETGLRLPSFGDYVINHPKEFEIDWRVAKPSATIRYTIEDGWFIVKGDSVRNYGFGQYHELSRVVLASRYYYEPTFSWGDGFIQTCSNKSAKTGNLSTWRQVGTNHHIMKIIQDIASFYAF